MRFNTTCVELFIDIYGDDFRTYFISRSNDYTEYISMTADILYSSNLDIFTDMVHFFDTEIYMRDWHT